MSFGNKNRLRSLLLHHSRQICFGVGMTTLKTKSVSTLQEYVATVEKLRRNAKGHLWYRGCGKLSHQLKPTLYRHKRARAIEDLMSLEKDLLARFQQRSLPFHPRPSTITNPWEWLFLMQHYGVPTRFLDWSESPLMALFFAVTSAPHALSANGRPMFAGDASVWVLDPRQWNKRAVDLKSFPGSILTTDDPNAGAYQPVGNTSTMKAFPIAIYGAHNSQRIVAQRGVFVCFGKDTRPMETVYQKETFPTGCLTRLVIKRGRLPHMHEALSRHGLTDSVAFPDLDGLAREIKREFLFEV